MLHNNISSIAGRINDGYARHLSKDKMNRSPNIVANI